MKRKQKEKLIRQRVGYNLNIWISKEIGELIESALTRIQPKTSKTALIETLIRDGLRDNEKMQN